MDTPHWFPSGACSQLDAATKPSSVPRLVSDPLLLTGALDQTLSRGRPFLCPCCCQHDEEHNAPSTLPEPIVRITHDSAWACTRWGLPCPDCHQSSGALLPHLFTLTCSGKTQRFIRPSAVHSLWHFPSTQAAPVRVCWAGWALPTTVSYRARTFLPEPNQSENQSAPEQSPCCIKQLYAEELGVFACRNPHFRVQSGHVQSPGHDVGRSRAGTRPQAGARSR